MVARRGPREDSIYHGDYPRTDFQFQQRLQESESDIHLLLESLGFHASGVQRGWIARAWQIAALLLRYDAGVRAVSGDAPTLLQAAKRQAEVLLAELSTSEGAKVPDVVAFLSEVGSVTDPGAAQAVWQRLTIVPPPVSIVGTESSASPAAVRFPSRRSRLALCASRPCAACL